MGNKKDVNLKYFKPNVKVESLDKFKMTSVKIIELFEDILSNHNIMIPDEDRIGDEDEACIYGMTYAKLEDDIVSILKEFVEKEK